jgi:integrase
VRQSPERMTSSILHAFVSSQSDRGLKANTINRTLYVLRAMLTYAGVRLPIHPRLFLKPEPHQVRRMEAEQIHTVIGQLRMPYRRMAELSVLALLRLSEILPLRRREVDLAGGRIHLADSSITGATTVVLGVVLGAKARRLLQKQLASHQSDWVFPGPQDQPLSPAEVSRRARLAAQAAAIPDFHFHDFRRHAIQVALDRRIPVQVLTVLGRWKSALSLLRYGGSVTEADLRRAADILAKDQATASSRRKR